MVGESDEMRKRDEIFWNFGKLNGLSESTEGWTVLKVRTKGQSQKGAVKRKSG